MSWDLIMPGRELLTEGGLRTRGFHLAAVTHCELPPASSLFGFFLNRQHNYGAGTTVTGNAVIASQTFLQYYISSTGHVYTGPVISTTFIHQADHMYREEYVEDDEEPPLLLYSCPSHSVWLWWDCSGAVSVGRGLYMSPVPSWTAAFKGL